MTHPQRLSAQGEARSFESLEYENLEVSQAVMGMVGKTERSVSHPLSKSLSIRYPLSSNANRQPRGIYSVFRHLW